MRLKVILRNALIAFASTLTVLGGLLVWPATLNAAASTTRRQLTSIWFSNPRVGFAAVVQSTSSSDGLTATCKDYIGRSTDGGHHFGNFIELRTWNCTKVTDAAKLTFDGVGDGFFYGPSLYETHNSGRTWLRTRVAGPVMDVSSVGRSVWMVEAHCSSKEIATNTNCPLEILQSSDGGRTWSSARSLPGPKAVRAGATSFTSYGQTILTRVSSRRAVYTVPPIMTAKAQSGVVPTWVTSNSGRTWVRRDIKCGMPTFSEMMTVTPSGTWIAACASQSAAGSQAKTIIKSTNVGRTWTVVHQCLWGTTTCPKALFAGYLGTLVAPSNSLLVETGQRSAINASRDGGRTWTSFYGKVWNYGGVDQVQFFNAREGIALTAATSLISVTSDGAAHWKTFRAGIG